MLLSAHTAIAVVGEVVAGRAAAAVVVVVVVAVVAVVAAAGPVGARAERACWREKTLVGNGVGERKEGSQGGQHARPGHAWQQRRAGPGPAHWARSAPTRRSGACCLSEEAG